MSRPLAALRHLAVTLVAVVLAACSSAEEPDTPRQDSPVVLFNILPLQAGEIDGFLPSMLDNAHASRQEAGNLSFDVFQPEDGAATLLLFERWVSQAALDEHFATPHLKVVERGLATAQAATPTSLRLVEIEPQGAQQRKPLARPGDSRNVIVILKARPEQEQAFLDAWREAIPFSRAAPGNHAFELYAVEGQPQTYVLFERWDSVASHEAHLAQDYSAKLDERLPGTLAEPITPATRFLARDVGAER
ncbi:putative quinol monooxygenase [Stutzerimonas kirkiae]|uniref:Antibiotic biosynthesis monooxygenase n=1 Tax=Stutzerimonas kirkiae TaxID=2211392 RepID=A0A4Q9RBT8_9GAMM|nr:antibiotic biosynthesis monooxygenase [Stutzerimonas kirkiae]TBU98528.1 antibiotic biosynthesis monooxygenase [Stutzerimonas kirkiae]TBV04297.1 antibiotic biosynthesis monooxygenase [Stutzerimonas kirkiae]TBV11001.1 antibiotic biosynthesis monooxygenase [Stutzerimonas kirkiae]TBV14360.1 antibiotic biosynthesis monooxygenase [Stutzerimonas kirkiae]